MKERNDITAAEWLAKLKASPMDEATDAEFRAWLDRDPKNEVDLERCEMAVALTEELQNDSELRPYFKEVADIADKDKVQARQPTPPVIRWRAAGPVLAAASVAALVIATVLTLTRTSPEQYQTAVGEQRTVVLGDQSTVTLNTDTLLSVELGSDVRRVQMTQGEAYFSVAEDANRPFEVLAGDGRVRAVSTAFNVAIDGSRVAVSVLEGRVAVLPPATSVPNATDAPEIRAGESLTYWSSGAIAEVEPADVRRIRAWREGRLDFDGISLGDAIEEHNRYTTQRIVIGSQRIRDLAVSGVLQVGDTDSLVFLLEESLGIRSAEQSGIIVLLAPPISPEGNL